MEKRQVRHNIRTLRLYHGEMTREQLAEKAGVTRQIIIAIEGGKYAPSLEQTAEAHRYIESGNRQGNLVLILARA